MSQRVIYQSLENIFAERGLAVTVAEAHGVLVGLLCVKPCATVEDWYDQVMSEDDRANLSEREHAVLKALFEYTQSLLNGTDYGFQPCLPDDEAALTARAYALKDWCSGFVYALGMDESRRRWSDDALELMRDFVEITKLDAVEDGEEDENAYTELLEFVRMGTEYIYSEK